uniref:Asparaginase n=1 Tax=Meloidogyne incognita TaxID=6306 RepID=A0A914LHF2_MELIC
MIAVHGGAGLFKEGIEQFCATALKDDGLGKAWNNLTGSDEIEVGNRLVKSIMKLEKCSKFNCGYGSNLTEAGTVECEGAFMCSENLAFGGVASVTNCAHPIYAAQKLAMSHKSNSEENGLIKPIVLAGKGANQYCEALNVGIVLNENLRTERAKRDRNLAINRVFNNEQNECSMNNISRLDTTGGVFIDENGYCEAGVSSGGILLKKEGRLGHSTHFGAAIWAEKREKASIAISLSGCGETLIRTRMAEIIAEFFFSNDLDDLFLLEKIKNFLGGESFLKSKRLQTFPVSYLLLGGIAAVQSNKISTLYAFHNSAHFPIAFKGLDQKIRKFNSKNEKVGNFVFNSFIL